MVKDKQARASRQEKITLRATPVGSRVMERLLVPNIDKSAELRRLVELGFACEQAGFILDGEVLRHGGRAWDIRPDLAGSQRTEPAAGLPLMAGGAEAATTLSPAIAEVTPMTPAPASVVDSGADGAEGGDQTGRETTGSSLRDNLRGLSG